MHYVSTLQAAHIDRKIRYQSLWQATTYGIKTFALTLLLGVAVFLAVSAPAQWSRVRYFFHSLYQQVEELFTDEVISSPPLSPTRFLGITEVMEPERIEVPTVAANHLVIPAIDVDAPLIWDVPLADALNGLQQGVVQAHESVAPRDAGRTFIIGHSSGYWWNKNSWTKVFALLDQVKPGDLIFLKDGDTAYGYRVTKSEVVSPDDVQVVRDASLDHNQLALMTCTPVGTTLNRLIVYAEPVVLQ